jgi:hypothetical protein
MTLCIHEYPIEFGSWAGLDVSGCRIEEQNLKSRLTGFVSALAFAVGIAVTPAATAQAATPAVLITKVYYNSPGTDSGTNTSLNAEWVRMTNKRTYTINLKSWTLRDRSGHVYLFSSNYYLGAGRYVYVHTGRGTNGQPDYQHRYWGSSYYIWNNTGDTAYLRTPSGTLVDSCSWGSSGSYTYC